MLLDGVQQATLQLRGTIRLVAIFEQALVDEDAWEAFPSLSIQLCLH